MREPLVVHEGPPLQKSVIAVPRYDQQQERRFAERLPFESGVSSSDPCSGRTTSIRRPTTVSSDGPFERIATSLPFMLPSSCGNVIGVSAEAGNPASKRAM